jgi:hypothetical protein
MHSYLIFGKGAKHTLQKTASLTNGAGKTGYLHVRKQTN